MGFGSFLGSVAGDIGGSIIGLVGQHQANQANKGMAREQMRFQERMSNSAYQRATDDMRAAGLNPMLAYGQGGASSPSGAMANMESITSGISTSALDMLRLKKDIEQANANIRLTNESVNTERIRQNNMKAEEQNRNKQNMLMSEDLFMNRSRANMYRRYPWLMPAEKLMEMIIPAAGMAMNPLGAFLGARFGSRNSASQSRDVQNSNRVIPWDGKSLNIDRR